MMKPGFQYRWQRPAFEELANPAPDDLNRPFAISAFTDLEMNVNGPVLRGLPDVTDENALEAGQLVEALDFSQNMAHDLDA